MLGNRSDELTHAVVQSAAKERQDGPAAAREPHAIFEHLPRITVDPHLRHTDRWTEIELVDLHADGEPACLYVRLVPVQSGGQARRRGRGRHVNERGDASNVNCV